MRGEYGMESRIVFRVIVGCLIHVACKQIRLRPKYSETTAQIHIGEEFIEESVILHDVQYHLLIWVLQKGQSVVSRIQTLQVLPIQLPGLDHAQARVGRHLNIAIETMGGVIKTVLHTAVIRQLTNYIWLG